ncbi:MAG: SPOR domain-containing protein [Dyella sp.]
MNARLLGAAVLIALAVIFVPMFFSSKPVAPGADQTVSLDIPAAPDRDLQTRTMSLTPGAAPAGAKSAAGSPLGSGSNGSPVIAGPNTGAPASGDALATVNIGSNRPRDVETDPQAGQAPQPTSVQAPGKTTPTPAPSQPAPAIPAQPRVTKPAASAPTTQAPAPAVADQTAVAARGNYSVNLSAYASAASAQNLMQRVRGMGYPVTSRAINQAGKALTLVVAGPFGSRAAAEAARLKITQSVPGVPARLESGASTQQGDAPALATPSRAVASSAPAASAKAGGWAVQVAAVGNQADANALRDKLRANGFDGFVDTATVGGKQLWRVRAGPQTQREDALRLRDQIKAKLALSGNVVSMP